VCIVACIVNELICFVCVSASEKKMRGKSSNPRGTRGRGHGQHPHKDTKVSLIIATSV